jgi:hypothetical protein
MAGHPKRSRLIKELEQRTQAVLGPGATPLDFLCDYLERGGRFAALARELTLAMGESISRPLVSNTARWLDADARARLAEARRYHRSHSKPIARGSSRVHDLVGPRHETPPLSIIRHHGAGHSAVGHVPRDSTLKASHSALASCAADRPDDAGVHRVDNFDN